MQLRRIADPTIPEKKSEPEPPVSVSTSFFEDSDGEEAKVSTVAPRVATQRDIVMEFVRPVGLTVLGVGMLAFGIWNAGGFYETGSRLSGSLATFFYTWQIANLMEIAGLTITYMSIGDVLEVWKSQKN